MTLKKALFSSVRKPYHSSPNQLANLVPYPKGTNGHKGGYNLTERLQHSLDHPLKEPKEDSPAGERLVYATLKGAIDLVPAPFREAWDRSEGKVPDKHAIIGDIIIEVIYGSRRKTEDQDTG